MFSIVRALLLVVMLIPLACQTERQAKILHDGITPDRKMSAEEMVAAGTQAMRRMRKRWGDAPIYVDGNYRGMLRFPELHPNVATIVQHRDIDGERIYMRRFAWAEMFAQHGVNIDKIKAVHFYGGRSSISMVDGDEFRLKAKTLLFSFTRGNGGKPTLRTPPDGYKTNRTVDMVRGVAIYVEREPPFYTRGNIIFPDGTKQRVRNDRGKLSFPYSSTERHGGSRVYVDGKYVAAFRRRALKPELQTNPSDETSPYYLAKTLSSFGVDLVDIKRIELWSTRDKLMVSLEGEGLSTLKDMTFHLAQHSRGRILVGDGDDARKLASVLIYRELAPADRTKPDTHGSDAPHDK
jgi:hypothetical protein